MYKVIAYTNVCVTQWNAFIRNNIIEDCDKSIITKNDLIMSYETIVDEFNDIIINNSEEYIIRDIVNYTNYEVYDNYVEPKINFTLKIREYFLEDNKMISQTLEKKVLMKRNNSYQHKQQKMDKCPKCGASIIGVFDKCSYCNEKQVPNKLWLLDKVI